MKILSTLSTRHKILTYRTTVVCGLLLVGLSLMLWTGLDNSRLVYAAEDLKAAADVDGSGEIDIRDLTLVGKHFNETIRPNQGVPNPDVDRDGRVNIRDLTLVAKYFGQTVAPLPVKSDGPITITDATFNKVALGSALPVVVYFTADWCPPCRGMAPIIKEAASENQETFLIAKLDFDENRQSVQKYRVEAIPTYIVFRNGKVIGRFKGGVGENANKAMRDSMKAWFVRNIFDILRG